MGGIINVERHLSRILLCRFSLGLRPFRLFLAAKVDIIDLGHLALRSASSNAVDCLSLFGLDSRYG